VAIPESQLLIQPAEDIRQKVSADILWEGKKRRIAWTPKKDWTVTPVRLWRSRCN
jgi:hypothetical protein